MNRTNRTRSMEHFRTPFCDDYSAYLELTAEWCHERNRGGNGIVGRNDHAVPGDPGHLKGFLEGRQERGDGPQVV